ncbi:MAG: dienelactone hydrolase family protein [Acidobacteriota bacterium]
MVLICAVGVGSQACGASALVGEEGLHNSTKRFTDPAAMTESDWSDPEEVERVWQAAFVRIPLADGEVLETRVRDLEGVKIHAEKRWPTVLYLHGCTGIWEGSYERMDLFADGGFAVIAPPSFAREKYPQSCDPDSNRGAFYRGTLPMRQQDAAHAIRRAKTLPWVDPERLFLVGFSQGGIVAATLATDEETRLGGRIIEGWTCHSSFAEYRGAAAPAEEPVLALVARDDPWYQYPTTKGDCRPFLNRDNGSRSVVFTDEALRKTHSLLQETKPQAVALHFLRSRLEILDESSTGSTGSTD